MPAPSLPAVVKPVLPFSFAGNMDGALMSRFCHQLDMYFKLVELTDDIKQGLVAVTLLAGPEYTWNNIQGNVNCWSALKIALLDYFKPADYTYKRS